MSHPSSFEAFQRTLTERFNEFQRSLTAMLCAFGSTSEEIRQAKATAFSRSAKNLSELLTDTDKPGWLQPLLGAVIRFQANPGGDNDHFIQVIAKHFASVKPIQLDSTPPVSPYDFDRLYETIRKEQRLGELFDAHIEAITRIIESGEIESVTVLEGLRQLIEVLTANRNGSYVAAKQSVCFSRFIHNTILIGLKKLPAIGTLVEAAEKTFKEVDIGFQAIDEEIQTQSRQAFSASLPRIERAPQIIEQQALALPSPANE